MKQESIQIGHAYACRISGVVVPVTITSRFERTDYRGKTRVHFRAVNQLTQRMLELRGAGRLRYEWPICVGCGDPIAGYVFYRADGQPVGECCDDIVLSPATETIQ